MRSFGEKLQTVSLERGRLCVGIDPHPGATGAVGTRRDRGRP